MSRELQKKKRTNAKGAKGKIEQDIKFKMKHIKYRKKINREK